MVIEIGTETVVF